jgi:hypothetical protein
MDEEQPSGHPAVVSFWVPIGPEKYLRRFLQEYGLTLEQVHGRVIAKTESDGTTKFYAAHSLLRSHGEFPCAGDAEALAFCREIAQEMSLRYGITVEEATARVNKAWGRFHGRQIWIVGLDLVYHRGVEDWAGHFFEAIG